MYLLGCIYQNWCMFDNVFIVICLFLCNLCYWLMFVVMLGVFVVVWLLWWLQCVLGCGVGMVVYWVVGSCCCVVEVNLKLCFFEKDDVWCQCLLCDSFDVFGVGIFEFVCVWWGSIDSIWLQVQIEGLEYFQCMQVEGCGVLLVLGYFMILEMCGCLLCDYVDLLGMYCRYCNLVYEWVVKFGCLCYVKVMYVNEDICVIVCYLKKGGFLWYVFDQDMCGKDIVFVLFFGYIVFIIIVIYQLVWMIGCVVILYFYCCEGGKYFLKIGVLLENFFSDDVEVDIVCVNQVIEVMVCEVLDQYLWIYCCFKCQLGGCSDYYWQS